MTEATNNNFSACDMATAAAQGFRDGVASVRPAATPEPASPWISVEDRLPESGRTVLAFYLNSHGKGRRIRAEYIAPKSREVDEVTADPDTQCVEYDEATDTYYQVAGWYELIDNWGEYTSIAVVEGEVSAWTPLPSAPEQPAKDYLVECDACPTSGGCVNTCMKAPAKEVQS